MKKLVIVLGLGLLGATSLFADYQLILTNKEGEQTKQCIKSYSFSNNLESLSRKKSTIDEYSSTKEVLTNKIFDDKPIYRRVLPIIDFTVPYNTTVDKYSTSVDNIDRIIKNDFSAEINGTVYTSSSNTFKSFIHYTLSSSEDEEVITKDIKDVGVQILNNYTYRYNLKRKNKSGDFIYTFFNKKELLIKLFFRSRRSL